MELAENEILPPREWYHDPILKNYRCETVALILINNNILPPKEWQHIINSK